MRRQLNISLVTTLFTGVFVLAVSTRCPPSSAV
jgi:hypothetical protein